MWPNGAIRPGCRRARQDAALKIEVRRVFDQNFSVYGVRKVWRQLKREGFDVARCTVSRLMRDMGLQGVIRGKSVKTTISDKAAPCPLDHVKRQFKAPRPNSPLALRLHLRRNLDRLRLRRLRHRRLCPQDRGLAGLAHGACGLRARCAGASPP